MVLVIIGSTTSPPCVRTESSHGCSCRARSHRARCCSHATGGSLQSGSCLPPRSASQFRVLFTRRCERQGSAGDDPGLQACGSGSLPPLAGLGRPSGHLRRAGVCKAIRGSGEAVKHSLRIRSTRPAWVEQRYGHREPCIDGRQHSCDQLKCCNDADRPANEEWPCRHGAPPARQMRRSAAGELSRTGGSASRTRCAGRWPRARR